MVQIILTTPNVFSETTQTCLRHLKRACAGIESRMCILDNCDSLTFRCARDFNRVLAGLRDMATSDLIVLADDDAFVDEQWVREALLFRTQHPDVGVIGARLTSLDGKVNHAGGVHTIPYGQRPVHWLEGEESEGPRDCSFVTGAASAMTPQALRAVGLFNEDFVRYSFDTDYHLRAWEAGLRVVYNPKMRGVHKMGTVTHTRVDYADVATRDIALFKDLWIESGRLQKLYDKYGHLWGVREDGTLL